MSKRDGHTYRHAMSCAESWCHCCRPCGVCGALKWCRHDDAAEKARSGTPTPDRTTPTPEAP